MTSVAIYGAGGFGKEARMIVDIISKRNGSLNFAGFVDDLVRKEPMANKGQFDDVIIAIADPGDRKSVHGRLEAEGYPFRPLIHPNVHIDTSNSIGNGSIICGGVLLTVDIRVGQFVIINLAATIGHDVTIGDFTSIMPAVNISGSVKIGRNAFIGSGATILQGLTIGDNAVIGAGAVVIRSVAANQKVVGVPARII